MAARVNLGLALPCIHQGNVSQLPVGQSCAEPLALSAKI